MKLMSAFRCVYLRKMATQGSLKRNNKMKRKIRVLDRTRHSQNTTKYCRNGLRMKIGIQHFGSAVLPLILIRYRNERVFASIRNHIMGRPKWSRALEVCAEMKSSHNLLSMLKWSISLAFTFIRSNAYYMSTVAKHSLFTFAMFVHDFSVEKYLWTMTHPNSFVYRSLSLSLYICILKFCRRRYFSWNCSKNRY